MATFGHLPEEIILSILDYTWEAWKELEQNHARLESPQRSFQSSLLPVNITEYLLNETQQQHDDERLALTRKYQDTLCTVAAMKLYSGNQEPFFDDFFEVEIKSDHKSSKRTAMDICSAAGIVAISEDDTALLTRVLKKGPFSVDTVHKFFGNPILVAAQKGSLESMKILLKQPRRKFLMDSAGLNALHIASRAGDVPMVKLLMEHPDENPYHDRHNGLHLALAAEKGHETVVGILLHSLDPRPSLEDVDGAITDAAGSGREGVVRYLWEYSSIPSNAERIRGGISQLRLDDKDNVNTADGVDGVDGVDGENGDDSDEVYLWLSNSEDDGSRTRFEVDEMFGASVELDIALTAAKNDHDNIVRLVLDSGVIMARNECRVVRICFQAALQYDGVKVAKLLVERFPALTKDKFGMYATTPLALAAACTATKVMKFLLERGGIDVNGRDETCATAICYAMRPPMEMVYKVTDPFEALRLLVAEDEVDVNCADKLGDNALIGTAIVGDPLMVDLLMSRKELDVNASNCFGETALSRAVVRGNTSVIKLLLARSDIKADERNKLGQTPFLMTAITGRVDIMEQFINRPDVNIEAKDPKGRTALWLAAERGNIHAVIYLIHHSAKINVDLNKQDDEGISPLEVAEQEDSARHQETVLALTEKSPATKTTEPPFYSEDIPPTFLLPDECCMSCVLIHPKAHRVYSGHLPGFSYPSSDDIDFGDDGMPCTDEEGNVGDISDFSVSDLSSSDFEDGCSYYPLGFWIPKIDTLHVMQLMFPIIYPKSSTPYLEACN
ncbi:ankyrin repeat protein [Nannizzia gypsea CBS 118893]|uniref:Ankyrin repeat protein n=1 Tax=Arthroderma gypseum (strain ATCC MYA-4604 / CBS 118893) TaxID=535722 RepID=E5R3Q8_ARTGP|nr:ankyrin repeat protein [Nannizzia gypsea CBS 118893]EFQ97182.1 ankyrin repeat protein [Nannizzia gypsea CBS 118893]